MQIRLEEEKDYFVVETLTREAFWNVYKPGCDEHFVLHNFRTQPNFVKELDYVIVNEGEIIAHIMYATTFIKCDDGRAKETLLFGPVSVKPELQGKGYGSALIKHTLDKAKQLGYGGVCITGNPKYYHRFGFVAGKHYGIFYYALPRSADQPFFMAKQLKEGYFDGIDGVYYEPEAYSCDEKELEIFDKQFCPKTKMRLPGQLV